jgi:hypothetical protein
MQSPSGTTGSSFLSSRRTDTSTTVPISVNRTETTEQSAGTTSNVGQSAGENGSVFTLTNIYTFGDNRNSNIGQSQQPPTNTSSDKYRIKSFVEVFDQPSSQQETELERHHRETHSSSTITRKTHTSASDTNDYDSSRFHHHHESISPSSTRYKTGSYFSIIINPIHTDARVRILMRDINVFASNAFPSNLLACF